MLRRLLVAAPIALIAFVGAGCDRALPTAEPQDHALAHAAVAASAYDASPSSAALATRVHAATARFHSTVQATKAGYAVASPCVASPAGGMGFHWVNGALVDPVFEPLRPEAILYAPDANGGLKKVAVEYIVVNVGEPAPTFGDQAFTVGGAPLPVPHWTLHVWLDEANPSGLFAPFNPNVSCPAP